MVMTALRWLSYLFIPVSILLTILVLPKVHLGSIHAHASWVGLSSAFSFILIAGGLGYLNVASDYSRYLPRNSSRGAIVAVTDEVGHTSELPAAALAASPPANQAHPPYPARMGSLLQKMGWVSGPPRSSPGG
jgi:hypothetical protein